jgi:transposase, IS6 family
MLSDRGVQLDHTTLFRWVQAYAPELDKRVRPHRRMTNGSWRVDEASIRVKGKWVYLYRAVDARGQTIDFLVSPRWDAAAARRFFRKALKQPHTGNPQTITVAKNAAYLVAPKAMKRAGELWRFAKLRQVKFLNNIIEQDHRRIKRLVRPGLGFTSFLRATQTIVGYEVMAMIRKGPSLNAPPNNMRAQRDFIAALFGVAA